MPKIEKIKNCQFLIEMGLQFSINIQISTQVRSKVWKNKQVSHSPFKIKFILKLLCLIMKYFLYQMGDYPLIFMDFVSLSSKDMLGIMFHPPNQYHYLKWFTSTNICPFSFQLICRFHLNRKVPLKKSCFFVSQYIFSTMQKYKTRP